MARNALSARFLSIASVFGLLVLGTGCPSKDKKEDTTPGNGSGSAVAGDPTDPSNIDPEGGLPDPGNPGDPSNPGNPSNPGDPGTNPGDPGDPSNPGDPSKPPPEIKPPGLDLTPAQKAAKVKEHTGKGRAALRKSTPDPDAAIAHAKSALAADETSIEAMVILAQANIVKRFYDQATDILEKALERGGAKNRRVHFLFGLVHDRTDQPEKAMAAYQRAVSLSPNYSSALMNLGVHYLANARYADARTVYEKLTGQLNYTTAAAWTNLGSSYRGQSARSGLSLSVRNQLLLSAENRYKRGISRDKNYANAYYNLGLLYLDSDPYPEGSGEMDRLKRLKRAKTYFDEYRTKPGANTKRVDEVAATAQKLIAREERLRKKAEERRKRDAARKAAGGD